MQEPRTLDRRQFTLATALAALSGVAITISGCGSSSSSPSSTRTTAATDKTGQISNNHGHVAVITAAQLTAGGALQLDITGTATHPHTVSLSGDEITAIAANTQIAKQSTVDNNHSHTVTFN